ncbi:sensor domain-containing diguanylate cyclase [Alishewanella sp. BS5-314]|uniref:sensor domain-containing diguanylate cyclase n=1 Tax=Alishewanella sp. BS5-314 TaxID=2755587 RepID=UPI0021BAC423|nr:sensor domain-containing diguanylate cyclase [Alishewanella sp. BS5-314]MCT8125461.1 sensor domain-containing diguanylate cyclase [Alishewanella sp. BS5-314]
MLVRLLSRRHRWLLGSLSALLFAGSIMLVEFFHQNLLQKLTLEQQQSLSRQLSLVRANIESELNANIFLADSLATIISVNPSSGPDDWELLAQALMRKATSIRNIAVAPDNIIRFIYPIEGNQAALGLDYRTVPAQFRTVELARQRQDIMIAGPLTLVQGGTAVIARMPIFNDAPTNQQYWGTCSVVIDIDKLFQSTGLFALANQGQLAMRGVDGTGAEGELFWGDAAVFSNAFAIENIRLLSGSWQIALALPQDQQGRFGLSSLLVRLVGYSLCILLFLALFSLYYAYRQARLNALQDPLTLLPNRRFAMQLLERLVNEKAEFSILSLDLDKFKEVNDNYGHAVGDALLQEVAKRLQAGLRASDHACRLSGDEFLVILPRVHREKDLQHIINKVSARLSDTVFVFNDKQFQIQYSLGYASFPIHATELDKLLHFADLAMYQQKAAHKANA